MVTTQPDASSAPRSGGSDDPWRLPGDAPIRLVCGELKGADRGPYADRAEHNHIAAHGRADEDALVDLAIHVSARNPGRVLPPTTVTDDLDPNTLTGHVVVLGNMAWTQLASKDGSRVRPHARKGVDGEIFVLDDESFEPDPGDGTDYSDVGFLWRGPNPYDDAGTMTICSGVYTRGVVGAVRALTDPEQGESNAAELSKRCPGAPDTFGVLFSVPVRGNETRTPRFTHEKAWVRPVATSS